MVGILAPNVPEYPIAYFGVALAGGTSTTVNGLYTERELALQLLNSGARFLFTTGAISTSPATAGRSRSRGRNQARPGRQRRRLPSYVRMLGEAGDLAEPTLDPATALVSLPYSSGTTGLAKGVMLSHRNIVTNLLQWRPAADGRPRRDRRGAAVLPHLRQTVVMNVGLLAGATIVTLPSSISASSCA